MHFPCSPSLLRRLLLSALERGLADSLSYPEGEEEECDEAGEDGAEQVELDAGEQPVGWRDRGGGIWEVHNGDRVPRGGVESCIAALTDRAGVAMLCAVGELHREFLPPIFLVSPTVACSHASNDSLCGDALPQEGCTLEQQVEKQAEGAEGEEEPAAQGGEFPSEHVLILLSVWVSQVLLLSLYVCWWGNSNVVSYDLLSGVAA